MTIIDGDVVELTNKNRQLPALDCNMGRPKAEIMAERFCNINPELKLHVISDFIRDDRMVDVLKMTHYDYIVDAIDTLARALVVKSVLEELKKAGDQLDDLQESIVPNSTPYVLSGQKQAGTVQTRDVETALRDNLEVRLFYDNLLTVQQQLLAMRLKSRTLDIFKGAIITVISSGLPPPIWIKDSLEK